ncbi:MAG TPA: mannosyltransferase family protein [Candidatus Eremiobacteraceae bacterium]|nr:mannosyltransferase family protein [Candidatus Eremiobacteraceae bacterium]
MDAAVSSRLEEGAPRLGRPALLLPRSARVGLGLTAFAGLSTGIFVWYLLATHLRMSGLASNVALAGLSIGLALAATAAWYLYSRWISFTCNVSLEEMLKADAWSYLPLVGLWAYIVWMPATLTVAAALAGTLFVLFVAIKIGTLGRYYPMVHHVSIAFIATRLPLIVIAPLSAVIIGQRQGEHFTASHNVWLNVWGRWDAQHYLTIATHGYSGKEMAFFPLYPWLIHVLGGAIGDHLTAGLIISNLSFFIALGYLYALTRLEYGDDTIAYHAIFYTAIFPTAIFFSAVYTESLFLALTVASVYYARHGNYVTAGIFGALASMTRVEGMLTAIPLAYEAWSGWRERRGTTLTRGIIGVALVPSGLLVYMAYLYALVGNPLQFMKLQDNWNRHLAPPWVSISNTIRELAQGSLASSASVNHMIELAFTIAFLALMIAAFRTLRLSYSLYFAASLLVPLSTSSLMSMPRFVLVIFPAFMLLALWGRNPIVNSLIVALFLPLLGLFTVLFADWYWLA